MSTPAETTATLAAIAAGIAPEHRAELARLLASTAPKTTAQHCAEDLCEAMSMDDDLFDQIADSQYEAARVLGLNAEKYEFRMTVIPAGAD